MLMPLSCTIGVRARAVCGKYRRHLRCVERASRRLYLWVLNVWCTSKEREHHGRWVAELMVTPRDLALFVHRPHFFAFEVFAWFSLMFFCPISVWSLLSSLSLVHQLDVGVPPNGTLFFVSPTTRHLLPDCMLIFWLCTCWLLLYFCLHRLPSFILVFVRTMDVFLDVFGFQVVRDGIL